MHSLEWKCLNFAYYFTEVCSQGSNWQYPSIGPDNGLAPIRRQAIIWTRDGLFTDAYMRHSASNELNRPDCLNVTDQVEICTHRTKSFNLCCPPLIVFFYDVTFRIVNWIVVYVDFAVQVWRTCLVSEMRNNYSLVWIGIDFRLTRK